MALITCQECGKEISSQATACPHCGFPLAPAAPAPAAAPSAPPARKQGTSPWTIIGWIFLGLFLLYLYSCARTAMRISEAASYGAGSSVDAGRTAPDFRVKVIDSGCQESSSGRYTTIRATVENTGTATIPFAKAFFEAYDSSGKLIEAKDTYFSPHDIQPGSRASADVMLRGEVARCGLIRMQSSSGDPVTLG